MSFMKNLNNYYVPDEISLEVIKRDYYYLPIISGVYFNTKHIFFQLGIIQFILQLIIFIPHIYIGAWSMYSLIPISFTLATYQFQIVCLMSFSIILMIVFQLHRTELDILHREMLFKFFEYEVDDKEFINKMYSDMWKEKMKLLLGPIFAFFGAANAILVGPILDSTFGTFEYNGTELSGRAWDLPIGLTWYPGIDDYPSVYYVVVVIEVFLAYFIVSILGSGGFLFINLTQSYCMHFKYLTHMVENLEERAEAIWIKLNKERRRDKCFLYDDPDFVRVYKECIKRNYEHHQLLITWLGSLQRFFSIPLGMAYFTGSFVIALSLLAMKTSTTLPGTLLSSIFFCLGEVGFMGLLSHLGQQITDLSDGLRFTMYSTKWYYCPKSFKKEMIVFQEMAQRQLKLEGFGMVTANMDTFGNVMNSAYSYYNLIMAF